MKQATFEFIMDSLRRAKVEVSLENFDLLNKVQEILYQEIEVEVA